MTRLLLTLVILVIVHNAVSFRHCPQFKHSPEHDSKPGHRHHCGHCRHRFHHNHEEDRISEIGRKYGEADDVLRNFCRDNTIVPKIIYSTTAYVIKYNLPDTKDLIVTITIQNQVLITNVTGTGVFKGFTDARVLPDILKVSDAEWIFLDTDLKILIPYKVPLGTAFVAECAPEDVSVINVPNPPALEIDIRNSEE